MCWEDAISENRVYKSIALGKSLKSTRRLTLLFYTPVLAQLPKQEYNLVMGYGVERRMEETKLSAWNENWEKLPHLPFREDGRKNRRIKTIKKHSGYRKGYFLCFIFFHSLTLILLPLSSLFPQKHYNRPLPSFIAWSLFPLFSFPRFSIAFLFNGLMQSLIKVFFYWAFNDLRA